MKTHFPLDEGTVKAVDGVDCTLYRNRTLCVVGESGCGKSITARSILHMHFPIRRGFLRKIVGHVRAVSGVSFSILPGETLGLVGESGCGKTTAGRCILRAYEPTGGQILYRQPDGKQVDLAPLSVQELKPYCQQIRMIFQDPYSSLNPRMTVLDLVSEPMLINNTASGSELQDRVALLLRRVGLRPEYMRRYPHAFSGGERQRLGIARAGARPASCRRRRGGLGARCLGARPDSQSAAGLAGRDGPHLSLCLARFECGRVSL